MTIKDLADKGVLHLIGDKSGGFSVYDLRTHTDITPKENDDNTTCGEVYSYTIHHIGVDHIIGDGDKPVIFVSSPLRGAVQHHIHVEGIGSMLCAVTYMKNIMTKLKSAVFVYKDPSAYYTITSVRNDDDIIISVAQHDVFLLDNIDGKYRWRANAWSAQYLCTENDISLACAVNRLKMRHVESKTTSSYWIATDLFAMLLDITEPKPIVEQSITVAVIDMGDPIDEEEDTD